MAIYYVDTASDGGDGTTPNLAGATAAFKTVAAVNAATFSAGDSVLFKRGCTWAEQLTPPSAGAEGNPIVFADYGSGDAPRITAGAASYCFSSTRNDVTCSRVVFSGKETRINGGLRNTFNYCAHLDSVGYGVHSLGAATVTLNNCLSHGNGYEGVVLEGTSTVTARNTLIYGNGSSVTYYGGVYIASGCTFDYDYCLLFGNCATPSDNVRVASGGTATDGGHNLVTVLPGVSAWKNGTAYFCLTIDNDDGESNLDDFTDLADALPVGVPATIFVCGSMITTEAGENALLETQDTHGWEVSNHGWSHSKLATPTTAFTVSTTNGGTCTLDVDTTAKTVSLTSSGNPENNVSVNFTNTSGPSDTGTIRTLKEAVQAGYTGTGNATGKGWTVANTSYVTNAVRLKALDDQTVTTFPATPTLNATAYWASEVGDAHVWLTTLLGTAPTTFCYPYGDVSADLRSYIQAYDSNAIKGARGYAKGNMSYTLSSMEMYRTAGPDGSLEKGDGSEAAIRLMARYAFAFAVDVGSLACLTWHRTSNLTNQQILWYVDEILALGGTFVTYADAVASVRADHTTSDGLIWTKTYPDQTNAHPAWGSPLIDAGTLLSLTPDLDGATVPRGHGVDIGAYEFQGRPCLVLAGA